MPIASPLRDLSMSRMRMIPPTIYKLVIVILGGPNAIKRLNGMMIIPKNALKVEIE